MKKTLKARSTCCVVLSAQGTHVSTALLYGKRKVKENVDNYVIWLQFV
jgi:hypothetical protein